MILVQLYLLICTLFLAGKDATSYLLKDHDLVAYNGSLTQKRIKRWHRDGVILHGLFVLPLITADPINWWKYLIYALLIRLAIFDLAFNKWSKLDIDLLGSTALVDKLFVKIFGEKGAIEKSIVFIGIIIALDLFLRENLVNSNIFRIFI